jgi:hypothetical protein
LALVALAEGACDEALQRAEQSLREWSQLGEAVGLTNALSLVGSIERQRGALEQATEKLWSATDAYLDVGNLFGLHWMLWEFVLLSEAQNDHRSAVLLAGAAETLGQEIGGGAFIELVHITTPYERAAEALSGDEVDALRSTGHQLDLSEALALANERLRPSGPPRRSASFRDPSGAGGEPPPTTPAT